MNDWNAIVTTRGDRWSKARKLVSRFGRVEPTGFHNVLVMKVDEPKDLLGRLEAVASTDSAIADAIAHVTHALLGEKRATNCEQFAAIGFGAEFSPFLVASSKHRLARSVLYEPRRGNAPG